MNKPHLSIDIYMIRSGQPRRYADHEYEADIVFTNWWESTTGPKKGHWCPDEARAKAVANLFIKGFNEDSTKDGLVPYLKSIEKIKPDTYRVLIVEPYCD